jgi:hypothetical protein
MKTTILTIPAEVLARIESLAVEQPAADAENLAGTIAGQIARMHLLAEDVEFVPAPRRDPRVRTQGHRHRGHAAATRRDPSHIARTPLRSELGSGFRARKAGG